MKRVVACLTAIVCSASACSTVTGRAARRGGHDGPTITVTGCVQNHGAKSSATMDGGYVLSKTETDDPSGRAESIPSFGPPSHRSDSYMLDGRDSELRNYIDHQVEVTGALEAHFDEPGDTNSRATRGSQMTHGRNTGLQWLRVASVKTISSGCSAK